MVWLTVDLGGNFTGESVLIYLMGNRK